MFHFIGTLLFKKLCDVMLHCMSHDVLCYAALYDATLYCLVLHYGLSCQVILWGRLVLQSHSHLVLAGSTLAGWLLPLSPAEVHRGPNYVHRVFLDLRIHDIRRSTSLLHVGPETTILLDLGQVFDLAWLT